MKRGMHSPMKWFFIILLSMLLLALAAALAGARSGNFANRVVGWEADPFPDETSPGAAVPVRLVMKLPFWMSPSEVSAVLPEHWIQSGEAEISQSVDRRLRREVVVSFTFTPLAAALEPADALITANLDAWWGEDPEIFEASVRLPGVGGIENAGGDPLPIETVGIIERVPPDSYRWLRWLILPAAAAAVVAVILATRSRSREPRAATPWEQALAELEELRRAVAGGMRPDEAILLLSDTVRSYLERRYRLPATRRTTPELLNMLRNGARPLPRQDRAALERFMPAAELVKFAGVRAEKGMLGNAIDDAENLVRSGMPSPGSEGGENV